MSAPNYGWCWRRFRAMSSREILHRAYQLIRSGVERLETRRPKQVPEPDLSRPATRFLTVPEGLDPAPYTRAADAVVEGRLHIFALQDVNLGNPPVWNRDPLTRVDVPLRFGKSIDYREPASVGDIKYLWEINRHLHLVTLAQAYVLTGRSGYLQTLRTHIDSWLSACPYPLGPNWTSALELGVRLVNWAIVWQLLAPDSALFSGDNGRAFRDRWLTSIYQHGEFVRRNHSQFSSANNHLIGEAAGLLLASLTWPYWDAAEGWRDSAWQKLARECLRQNEPDGVNREQSTGYQQFVLDLLILAGLAARAAGRDFPAAYWQRLESMMDFIASLMDASGRVPMIGDADNGYATGLAVAADHCPYRSLLATGAVLFLRPEFKVKAGSLDDKTLWLLGDSAQETFRALSNRSALRFRRALTDGGYYVMGAQLETAEEIRLVVDAGPLGYLSIAAHGHADALAYTLSVCGEEILIDPGTYAYHTNKRWREYFRGTSAHNTIRVDGLDQSVIGGNFLWMEKAQAKCEAWQSDEDTDRFVGCHDGYLRLRDPLLHRREVILCKKTRRILIVDTLECRDEHWVELFGHFAEHCQVTLGEDGSVQARGDRIVVEMRVGGQPLAARLYRGDDRMPAGWVSRVLDVKVPTTTVLWEARINGNARFTTEILCHPCERDR